MTSLGPCRSATDAAGMGSPDPRRSDRTASTCFGGAGEMMSTTSAPQRRWSSPNFAGQPSLQAWVRLDFRRMPLIVGFRGSTSLAQSN